LSLTTEVPMTECGRLCLADSLAVSAAKRRFPDFSLPAANRNRRPKADSALPLNSNVAEGTHHDAVVNKYHACTARWTS